MENNEKRKVLVITTIVCVSLLVGILESYAFFVSSTNNNKPEEASVETGNLSLIFEDGTSSFQGTLNFGDSATKTFTIENNGSLDAKAVMYFDNLVNTYLLGSLTYTLSYSETENGEYQELVTNSNVPRSEENTSRTLADNLSIPSKQKYYYKLTITLNYLSDTDQTADLSAIFSSNFKLEETENKALDTLKSLGLKVKKGSPDFALTATTDETKDGLYSMEDDYGTSYYFRGAVENNYVKFAGFYWRIIRINGDGSLRIQYDGTKAHANGESSKDRVAFNSVWNSNSNDIKYVGYMYSPSGTTASTSKEQAQTNETDSDIKIALDNWYKLNIEDRNYSKYIEDVIFCNDRSLANKSVLSAFTDTGLGYGTNPTTFQPVARDFEANPTLKCTQKNDTFTKNEQAGNGKLKYPVGLAIADEFLIAGSGKNLDSSNKLTNTSFYLYKGVWQWAMTPIYFYIYSGTAGAYIYSYNSYQCYGNDLSTKSNGVAPVINIKSEYTEKMQGTGYMNDPYIIQ